MKSKKSIIVLITILFSIALFSVGCRKKHKEEIKPEPQITAFPGLGNNAGTPTGVQFVLPSYVTVVGNITGGIPYHKSLIIKDKKNSFISYSNMNDSIMGYAVYGTGTYVDIVAKFASSLNHDTTLLLPAGLIFVDPTGGSQNGFILQDVYIPLGAYDTAYSFVKAYCLNAERHISYDTTIYNASVVTDNSQLLEVINILKSKQVPIGNEGDIQTALWHISDYYGLTDEDRNFLNSLP